MSGEAPLLSPDPSAYLPHRNPFLFIDQIISLEPGKCATGLKRVTGAAGLPSFLLFESMAQLAGVAVVQEEGEGGFLAAVERGEVFSRIASGDTLLVAVRILHSFGRLFLVEGEVSVAGRQVAIATLTLGVGKL